MSAGRIWILGASDPEMDAIEMLLHTCLERVAYATVGGVRVHPGNAYRADAVRYGCGDHGPVGQREEWLLVECDVPVPRAATLSLIDHHRPGDPGFGRPPSEFWTASSLGQVYTQLNLGPAQPDHLAFTAAADHCLGAAYRGECPGVDPSDLGRWRAESRAAFQGRTVEAVLADVDAAQQALQDAPQIVCEGCAGYPLADMRRPDPIPELPDAATRLGLGYVAGPLIDPDGRRKFTCSGSPEQVSWWMESWAPRHGIADIYGDPARGFAGGYTEASRRAAAKERGGHGRRGRGTAECE